MKIMLKFLLLATVAFGIEIKPIKLTITSVDVDKKTLMLKSNGEGEISTGETGIIMHKIGAGIISNSVTITQVDGDKISASYEPFTLLEQKYLPTPVVKPKEGDEVIFRSLYARGFIAAPNQKVYESIKALFPNIYFASSDLMIADIGGKGILDPSKKAFKEMCKIYSVGILAIYASNGVNLLDCQSFQVLERQTLDNPEPKEMMYPFFARVEAKSFWDFLKRKKNYFEEYDKLLKSIE